MSSIPVPSRLGFAVVAVLLMAGCGGGTSKTAAANSTSPASSTTAASSTSSAQAGNAPLADTPFCQQLTTSMGELSSSFTGASDPASLGAAVKKEAELVRSIHPPDEIAADWKTLSTALDGLASSYGKLDPHNPASASTFLGQNQAQLSALTAASSHLENYLSTKCGITAPTSLPTAPSS